MKKKAVIVSLDRIVSTYLKEQLDQLLGGVIEFDAYSLDVGISGKIACDLCIFPTEDSLSLNIIAEKMLPGTQFLSVKRTLKKGEWDKIIALPYGTKALLVNTSHKLALEAISFLLELGANHITFFPYYPGADPYPADISIAITPDEESYVPATIRQIVNIGPRVIDSSTIFEITNMLKMVTQYTRDKLLDYMSTVMPRNVGLLNYINQLMPEIDFLREIVYVSNYIIIATDDQNRIIYNSRPDRNIANRELYGKKIHECFNSALFQRSGGFQNEFLEINGKNYLISKMDIYSQNAVKYAVYALVDYSDMEALVNTFQQSKSRHQNKAKYTFKDIIGNSDSLIKVKKLAQKAASTELDILIEAETGTGKELFANSIHNASKRKEGPFIAFNCAALSSNLLESELFGYEEGAFTGAKKGGRYGLVEAANNGTLFLDEIGEISPSIQVKLLRVLQEREVIRVGGTNRIPVNIRVIAATNKNLNELVAAGVFRKDLFYRLSVLPIRIPPLRERPEDIILLISSILKNRDIKMDLSDEVITALTHYDWPGNVRELINCCEYIINMEEQFSVETLPYYMREQIVEQMKRYGASNSSAHSVVSGEQPGNDQAVGTGDYPVHSRERLHLSVLKIIQTQTQSGRHAGRKSIADALSTTDMPFTEGEVRTLLKELHLADLVDVQKGRAGTRITQKGYELLNKYGKP